jgi:ribosomal protein S12 methylthiotransferase accessory factor
MTEPFARFEGPATPFAEGVLASLKRQPPRGRSEGEQVDASPVALAMFPLDEAAAAMSCETEATGDGLLVCHVGYDATRLVVGPIVARRGAPCLQCARLWAPALDRGAAAAAAAMPVPDLVAAQLASFVAAFRPGSQRDEAKVLWFDLETLAQSEHRLVPHPDCDRCGRSDPVIPKTLREDVPVSAETWREREKPDRARIERLVDSQFGLVRRFERETEALVHPMTFAAFVGRDNPRQLEIGVGRAGCQAEDRGIAILEAVERFSSFRPRGGATRITGRFVDVQPVAIDPRAFILPDPEQYGEPGFNLAAFDPHAPYEWGWAYSIGRRAPVLIPLQLAYYDLPRAELPVERQFVFETSNGCALGSSLEEAALFGLFEVLERDAYLTSWYGRFIPGRIDPRSIDDPYSAAMIVRIEEAGFEVSILDVGVGLPVAAVAVLAVDARLDAPVASIVSTGAHLSATQALRGALVEVGSRIQRRPPGIVAESHARAEAMLRDGSLVMTMDDHATLYSHHDSLARLAFLTASDEALDFNDAFAVDRPTEPGTTNLTNRLLALSDEVLAVAEDVLIVDLTNRITSSVGLHCVKVLAPGLLPVTFGHRHRRVSAARIAKVRRPRAGAEQGSGPCLPHNFQ